MILTYGGELEAEIISASGALLEPVRITRHRGWPWTSAIGLDAAGNILEFRCQPALRPLTVVTRLARLAQRAEQAVVRTYGPGTVLAFGSHKAPTGLHLHYGFPGDQPPSWWYDSVVKELAAALGFLTNLAPLRVRYGYGSPYDWRFQPWGFEWRALPAALFGYDGLPEQVVVLAAQVVRTRYMYDSGEMSARRYVELRRELKRKKDGIVKDLKCV